MVDQTVEQDYNFDESLERNQPNPFFDHRAEDGEIELNE